MVEIHNTVTKVFEENREALEIFECKDEFSDTQNFCDYYGFDIEDSCIPTFTFIVPLTVLLVSKLRNGHFPPDASED